MTGLFGFPSTDYVLHTLTNHLEDYGGQRYEMGYACAVSVVLLVIIWVFSRGARALFKED